MTRASLARRTVGYLMLAQIVAFVLAWSLTLVLGFAGVERFAQSWDELATTRTIDLVIASLRRDADGAMRVEPTPELRAERSGFPNSNTQPSITGRKRPPSARPRNSLPC